MPASSRSARSATLNRRRFVALAAGGGVLAAGGCGRRSAPKPTAIAVASPGAGTPVPVVAGFEDPRRWAGRRVRVGAWGGEVQDALRAAVWQPFAAATGAEVVEVATDYAQLAASLDAGAPYADALVADAVWAHGALDGGQVQALAAETIAAAPRRPIAPSDHALPAYAYALVGAYRWDHLAAGPPQSWAEWWDGVRYPEPRALFKGALGTFEFALLADGVEPTSLYPLDNDRAIESLRRISGKIVDRWWESGQRPVGWLASERAQLVSAWHHRVVAGMDDGQPIDVVWNEGLLVADRWVIPAGAENADVANDLLRYAVSAPIQAALAGQVPLGPIAPEAFETLADEVAVRLPTAPDNLSRLVHQDVAWWATNGLEAEQRFNGWLLGVP